MTDILAALIVFLKADVDVAGQVGLRIYGGELPRSEVDNMPRKVAVIRYSGGIENNSFVPLARPRVDITSYGATYFEAGEVDRAIYTALKAMDRETVDNALLHGAAMSGGPMMLKDPQAGWPYQWRSVVVTADERETL